MAEELAPLKPQVYLDPRPAEYFTRYYEHARTHEPDCVYDLARLLLTPPVEIVYRARCLDAANVPSSGGAILAPNHFSTWDHFFCGVFVRRRVHFMAKSQLFRPPLMQSILRHGGAFPVRRGQQDEQSIATAEAIVERGGVLVLYPEGGRSRSGRIGERGARPGIGRLALETGSPVVPVAIHGSLRVRNWRRLEAPRVTVRYGEPMHFGREQSPSRERQQAVADAVLEAIKDLYETLATEGAARWRTAPRAQR